MVIPCCSGTGTLHPPRRLAKRGRRGRDIVTDRAALAWRNSRSFRPFAKTRTGSGWQWIVGARSGNRDTRRQRMRRQLMSVWRRLHPMSVNACGVILNPVLLKGEAAW